MTQTPILKVLSIFRKCQVKSLLIGGQACIIYGAAEFSRDSDFIVLYDADNLSNLKKSLRLLKAVNIYVPPLKKEHLDKGHACHFRCFAKGVEGLRVDIIGKMRGCAPFEELWNRRFELKLPGVGTINVLSIKDLVNSKKTQRDKDWLMLKRLVENDILFSKIHSTENIKWWLSECRSASELIRLAKNHKKIVKFLIKKRPLLRIAIQGNERKLEALLLKEELLERKKDRAYWLPLIKELEILRHMKTARKLKFARRV